MPSQTSPAAVVPRTLGPYRIGEQLAADPDRLMYTAVDSADGSPVLLTVVRSAPRSAQAARNLVTDLAECPQLAVPLALARRADALLIVDEVDADAARSTRRHTAPLTLELFRQAVRDLALAVEALHTSGLAHGAINHWSIQISQATGLQLRGAAAAVSRTPLRARNDLGAMATLLLALAPQDADEQLMQAITGLQTGGDLRELIDAAAALPGDVAPERSRTISPERHLRLARTTSDGAAPRRHRPGPRHAAASTGPSRRTIAGAVVLLLAAVVAAIAAWPRAADHVTAGASDQVAIDEHSVTSWHQRLDALYATRADAFTSADPQLLAQVYTPGSRQLYADTETIESLRAQEREVVGFAPQLLQVESVEAIDGGVSVVVLDEIGEFSIIDATGTAMPVAGRTATRTTFVLQQTDGSWRIQQVSRAG